MYGHYFITLPPKIELSTFTSLFPRERYVQPKITFYWLNYLSESWNDIILH
jgi:hypothetical protein